MTTSSASYLACDMCVSRCAREYFLCELTSELKSALSREPGNACLKNGGVNLNAAADVTG